MWANNPALAAVAEAVHFLKVPLDRIEVLTVGTTYAPDSVQDLAGSGLFGWDRRIVDLPMNAQGEALEKAILEPVRARFLNGVAAEPFRPQS